MTYQALAETASTSFFLNCIIGDLIANARFCYTKAAFKKAVVSAYDVKVINGWAEKEGVESPFAIAL